MKPNVRWFNQAIRLLLDDAGKLNHKNLIPVALSWAPQITLVFLDESRNPSGSIKHRLAKTRFLHGLCSGGIREGTMIIESSSGNAAISEAYFARQLRLPFIALVPAGTSEVQVDNLAAYDSRCRVVAPDNTGNEARKLAEEEHGYWINDPRLIDESDEWYGTDNLAEALFAAMNAEFPAPPAWVVCAAGTGATAAMIARHIHRHRLPTRLCAACPERSMFYDAFRQSAWPSINGLFSSRDSCRSKKIQPNQVLRVPDGATHAALRFLEATLDRQCGASTGTNLYAAIQLAEELSRRPDPATIVTLICDGGARYQDTFYSDD